MRCMTVVEKRRSRRASLAPSSKVTVPTLAGAMAAIVAGVSSGEFNTLEFTIAAAVIGNAIIAYFTPDPAREV
jgi:hypothetical protein